MIRALDTDSKRLCPGCGQTVRHEDASCYQCGRSLKEILAEQAKPIGGWLLLVALAMVVYPILLAKVIFKDFLPMFRSSTWSMLTTPGTNSYDPFWKPVLITELAGNIVFLLFSAVLVVFFFLRKRAFFKIIVAFLFSLMAFIVFEYVAVRIVPLYARQFDILAFLRLVIGQIICAACMTYFILSKRVKDTFIL